MSEASKLRKRLEMLERFTKEARRRLDATPPLSANWFYAHREWKQLDQQRFRARIELNMYER